MTSSMTALRPPPTPRPPTPTPTRGTTPTAGYRRARIVVLLGLAAACALAALGAMTAPDRPDELAGTVKMSATPSRPPPAAPRPAGARPPTPPSPSRFPRSGDPEEEAIMAARTTTRPQPPPTTAARPGSRDATVAGVLLSLAGTAMLLGFITAEALYPGEGGI
jgi:hypothetical protein